MSVYDLTGQEVSDTYYRIVQVVSGSLYDGYGNPVALEVSGTVNYNNILDVPFGIISSSNQLPSGLISSSAQLPDGIISSSNGFISSSTQIESEISGAFTAISASLSSDKLNRIGSNVYSASSQLPSGLISSSAGFISSSNQISTEISGAFTNISASLAFEKLDKLNNNVYSSSTQLPSGIISSSAQLPSGLISSSVGFISSSNQIATEISGAFTNISASLASEKLDKLGANILSSSAQLPSGIISSSNQLPVGLLSSSIQIAVDISGSFTLISSSLASEKLNKLGSGVYSSSQQLPNGIISSSTQFPSGIISSSNQLPNGLLSSSVQIATDISGAFNSVSSSIANNIAAINAKLIDSFGIVINGGNNAITTGSKNIARAKSNGELIAYQLDSYLIGSAIQPTGSIGINVLRNGITMGTASMASTASYYTNTLTGWNTSFNKNDKFEYSVTSNVDIQNITLTLFYNIN